MKTMNPEDFKQAVFGLYQQAQTGKAIHERICRGRATDISAQVEALVAQYLISHDHCERFTIYIDYYLKLPLHQTYFYPDLLVVKDQKEITALVEIKTDLGYIRPSEEAGRHATASGKQRPDVIQSCAHRFEQLRSHETVTLQIHGKERTLTVNQAQLSNHLVICIQANSIKEHLLQKFQQEAQTKRVELHLLLQGEHPNAMAKKTGHPLDGSGQWQDKITANTAAFDTMCQRILSS